MPETPRDAAVRALRELMLACELFRQRAAIRLGVGITETQALSYLTVDGDLGQTELAHRLGITASTATSLVDRLEAAGLAVRHPDPGDRRRTSVRLTAAGRQAVEVGSQGFAAALDDLPDDRLAGTTDALTRLARSLRAGTDQTDPASASR